MESATATSSSGLPGLPNFPPGVNPETYQLEEVTALLKRAAFLPLFSMPSNIPNVPLAMPGDPSRIRGIEVHENVHRFDLQAERTDCGLWAGNTLGQQAGTVHVHWLPVPEEFEAAPNRIPPSTALDPSRSQRFVMMDGEFRFDDPDHSGFHGFGAGRTFPVVAGGRRQLRIGAVVEILEGLGRLKNCVGNVVVNGYIAPPQGLALNLMVRIMDPHEDLLARGQLDPIVSLPLADPDATFFAFLGERDPANPITLNSSPDGKVIGAKVHERLRLVLLSSSVRYGLRSRLSEGPIVGNLSFLLDFNLMDPRIPSPFVTRQGVFTFFGCNQRPLGTVQADIVEGRAFRTTLQGPPMPVFRMVGFGPLRGGSGAFANAAGMLSLNGVISVFPRSPSLLYVFRFQDPGGKLRLRLQQGWSR